MMKKTLLVLLCALLPLSLWSQGEVKAGISGALPIGDAADLSSFGLGVDLAYLFEISTDFQAGPVAGFAHFFGEELAGVEIDDPQFVPVGGRAQLFMSRQFAIGGEGGYAFGLSDGNDGGFFIKPRLSIDVTPLIDVFADARFIFQDGQSFNSISVGLDFKFGSKFR